MKRLPPLAPLALLLLTALAAGSCDSKPLGSVDGCTYKGNTYPASVSFPAGDGCNTCSCQDGQALCTLVACLDASTDSGSATCFDSKGNVIACPTVDGGGGDAKPGDGGATDGGAKDGGAACSYNGKTYALGASFTCSDGCNTCTCTANGIAGTAKACVDASADVPPTCFDSFGNLVPCTTDGGVQCLYDNKAYPPGASVPSADACNTCSCTAGGMIACTQKACADGGPPSDGAVDGPVTCFDANGKIAPCAPDGGPAGVCMPGADQGCNDDPTVSSLLGKCRPDYTCDCGANMLNPMTGRCFASTMPTGCTYEGTTYPLGSKFMCSLQSSCSGGVCVCATPGVTVPLCGGAPPVCGFDAVYVYGQIGGLVAYTDQVTLTPPASWVLVRTPSGTSGALGGSCGPALPACTAGPIDVSDIMRDIADPTVQLLLSLSATQSTLLGIDQRPVDGPIFSFKKSGTAGFLVGAPCNGASNCTDVPGSVRSLMDDLQKLDAQQRQDPSCTAFIKM